MNLLHSPEFGRGNPTLIFEQSGGPRTGKGTITGHLGRSYPGAATDETGADYRAVTLGMIKEGSIEQGMDKETVVNIVMNTDMRHIADLAARRYEIVASYGKDALHAEEVGSVVGWVSPHDHVREAVKAGFTMRIEQHVKKGTPKVFVDGRNLGPTINKIAGAKLVLRMFVDCEVPVAVMREAKRKGVDLNDPGNEEWYQNEFGLIMRRRTEDENRANDAAIKDPDAINYWYNTAIRRQTARQYAHHHGLTESQAMLLLTQPENIRIGGRIGAGSLAYATGRQVYFDTTEIGEDEMKEYAKKMIDESLDAYSEMQ